MYFPHHPLEENVNERDPFAHNPPFSPQLVSSIVRNNVWYLLLQNLSNLVFSNNFQDCFFLPQPMEGNILYFILQSFKKSYSTCAISNTP